MKEDQDDEHAYIHAKPMRAQQHNRTHSLSPSIHTKEFQQSLHSRSGLHATSYVINIGITKNLNHRSQGITTTDPKKMSKMYQSFKS